MDVLRWFGADRIADLTDEERAELAGLQAEINACCERIQAATVPAVYPTTTDQPDNTDDADS